MAPALRPRSRERRCAVARGGGERERLGPRGLGAEAEKKKREDAPVARGEGRRGREEAQTRTAIASTDMRAVASTKEVAANIAETKKSPG